MKSFIRSLIIFFTFWIGLIFAHAQGLLSAKEVLAKSIEYHDPEHQWNQLKSILNFHEQQPEKTVRKTRV
ncbi:MAG: hypothetical protein CMB82_00005, partial [Flammeovirgaceae bacterium]|nr:hypothetical protein [Flammeovirgaceae bacterium]